MKDPIRDQFLELDEEAMAILATKRTETRTIPGGSSYIRRSSYPPKHKTYEMLDKERSIKWFVSAGSLLERLFKKEGTPFKDFRSAMSGNVDSPNAFSAGYAIFKSVKDDYEKGFLYSIEDLAHKRVFNDELEQAEYFLEGKWKIPAAVIAGTILETSLRNMLKRLPNPPPGNIQNINRLNDELRKGGAYNIAVYRQVATWGDIRNYAAHGKPDKFGEDQVKNMISGIRDFLSKHLG